MYMNHSNTPCTKVTSSAYNIVGDTLLPAQRGLHKRGYFDSLQVFLPSNIFIMMYRVSFKGLQIERVIADFLYWASWNYYKNINAVKYCFFFLLVDGGEFLEIDHDKKRYFKETLRIR